MPPFSDEELFRRQADNMAASWAAYAKGSAGAAFHEQDGVGVAIFPTEPERAVYNNSVFELGLGGDRVEPAIDTMERLYREAGIDDFAVWVHETDEDAITGLRGRGYRYDSFECAMGMSLDDIKLPRPQIELGEPSWEEYLRILEVPDGLLAGCDPADFHILIATLDGQNVATAMAFDHDGDCGIYNVVTMEHARRRGIGTALTALHVHDARERGCLTASLQSTEMAQRVYAAVGFRDLGRYHEYTK